MHSLLLTFIWTHTPSPSSPSALQLYELAASGVRERAKLRQEVNEVQQELQGTRRQVRTSTAALLVSQWGRLCLGLPG